MAADHTSGHMCKLDRFYVTHFLLVIASTHRAAMIVTRIMAPASVPPAAPYNCWFAIFSDVTSSEPVKIKVNNI